MSKVKRLLSIMVAMVMVLAMSVPAFAAGASATITLENFNSANKVEYLQIIEPDQTTTSGWKFVNNAANAFKTAVGVSDEQQIIWGLIKYNDSKVILPTGVTAATVTAAQIDAALSTISGLSGYTEATDKTAITATSAGVYAIKATETGYTYKTAAAYVGFGEVNGTYPALLDTKVTAKKSSTKIDKSTTDTDHVAAIGDIVTYTIKTYVPFIDAQNTTNRTFKITDTITGADYYLTGEGSVSSVLMTGQTEQAGTIVVDSDGKSFTVDLSSLVSDVTNPNAGKEITITYTAKVNATTVENTAVSHVPDVDIDGSKVNLYSGKITLTKFGEKEEKLPNAEFEVYTKDAEGNLSENALTFTKDTTTGVYKYDPTSTTTTIVTGTDGTVAIEGLNVGTYHFKETKAPAGYSINTDGVDVPIAQNGVADKIIEETGSLTDTKLNALPSTGGIGTTIFTIGGCAIMIVAAGLFFATRRKTQK